MKRILLLSSLLCIGAALQGRCPCPVGRKRAMMRKGQAPIAKKMPVQAKLQPVKLQPAAKQKAPAPTPKKRKLMETPMPPAKKRKLEPIPMVKGSNKIVLQSAGDFDKHLGQHPVVVAIFSTTWCGPCKQLKPVIEQLTNEMKNVLFLHVDGDTFGGLVGKYSKLGFPTVKIFKNGSVVGQAIGAQSKSELQSQITPHLK